MPDMISRKVAKASGLKKYFTGVPCKNGHLSERFVVDCSCCVCKFIKSTQWAKNNHESILEFGRRYKKNHKEKIQEYRNRPETKERAKILQKKLLQANPGRAAKYVKKWKTLNREKFEAYRARPDVKARMRETSRNWAKNNPGRATANYNKRRAIKKHAMVSWADQEKIQAIYDEASRLTRETGTPYEVDHIYPLQGKYVCGLHHDNNLRIIPRSVNRAKSNKMPHEAA